MMLDQLIGKELESQERKDTPGWEVQFRSFPQNLGVYVFEDDDDDMDDDDFDDDEDDEDM
jgi:hypothetical protein